MDGIDARLDAAAFRELVRKLREAQNNYYRTERMNPKKHEWMIEAKRLERVVDLELKKEIQPSIF